MENELSNELDDMIKTISGVDQENSIPEGQDQEPVVKEPVVESEPKPEPKVDEKDSIIEELRKRIDGLESRIQVKSEPKVEIKPEPKVETKDFIGNEDLYELTSNKDKLNALLNSVYTQGIEYARKITNEIPEMVRTNISIVEDLRKTSEKFYDDNKDLAPFKRVVASVFEELASKNPDKKYQDILSDVATESRKRLELSGVTQKPTAPHLPKNRVTAVKPVEKPSTSPLVDEITAMNEALGG